MSKVYLNKDVLTATFERLEIIFNNFKRVYFCVSAGKDSSVMVQLANIVAKKLGKKFDILYIDLATDSIPSICLAFERASKGIMKRKPKPVNRPFFTPFIIATLAASSIFEGISGLLVYHFSKISYGADVAQTMAFLCIIVQEMVYAINCRNLKEPIFRQGLFSNKAMNIGMLILTIMQILVFCTPIGQIFKITQLTLMQVLIILLINIVAFLFIEISKPIIAKFFKD